MPFGQTEPAADVWFIALIRITIVTQKFLNGDRDRNFKSTKSLSLSSFAKITCKLAEL